MWFVAAVRAEEITAFPLPAFAQMRKHSGYNWIFVLQFFLFSPPPQFLVRNGLQSVCPMTSHVYLSPGFKRFKVKSNNWFRACCSAAVARQISAGSDLDTSEAVPP